MSINENNNLFQSTSMTTASRNITPDQQQQLDQDNPSVSGEYDSENVPGYNSPVDDEYQDTAIWTDHFNYTIHQKDFEEHVQFHRIEPELGAGDTLPTDYLMLQLFDGDGKALDHVNTKISDNEFINSLPNSW